MNEFKTINSALNKATIRVGAGITVLLGIPAAFLLLASSYLTVFLSFLPKHCEGRGHLESASLPGPKYSLQKNTR